MNSHGDPVTVPVTSSQDQSQLAINFLPIEDCNGGKISI